MFALSSIPKLALIPTDGCPDDRHFGVQTVEFDRSNLFSVYLLASNQLDPEENIKNVNHFDR